MPFPLRSLLARSLGIHDRRHKNADKKGPRSEEREETTLTAAAALFTLHSLTLHPSPHRRYLLCVVATAPEALTDAQCSRSRSGRMIMPPNMFELTPEGWITTVEMCMPDLEGREGRPHRQPNSLHCSSSCPCCRPRSKGGRGENVPLDSSFPHLSPSLPPSLSAVGSRRDGRSPESERERINAHSSPPAAEPPRDNERGRREEDMISWSFAA